MQRTCLVISIPMLTVRCHRDHPETVIIFEIITCAKRVLVFASHSQIVHFTSHVMDSSFYILTEIVCMIGAGRVFLHTNCG